MKDHLLQRQFKRSKAQGASIGLLLVSPMLLLTILAFAYPIVTILLRAVDDREVARILPATTKLLSAWNGETDIPAQAFGALVGDAAEAYSHQSLARAADRLNLDSPGFRSLLMQLGRRAATLDRANARQAMIDVDKRWEEVSTWRTIRMASGPVTSRYLLAAIDLRQQWDGTIVSAPKDQRIYVDLLLRTVTMSAVVLALCIVLGYPVAYWMAHQSSGVQRMLFYCVILPFWTSLLVRTGAWLVLLQKEGVINGLLIALGWTDQPLQLVFNRGSVYVVMTNMLLPFMILPIYSVMRRISPETVKAAAALGASPFVAFATVFLPQSIPGVAAGSLIVFVLALGFYITPQLIGGAGDQMISNMIAYYAVGSANWGMAGALASVVVLFVWILFPLYRKYLGFSQVTVR